MSAHEIPSFYWNMFQISLIKSANTENALRANCDIGGEQIECKIHWTKIMFAPSVECIAAINRVSIRLKHATHNSCIRGVTAQEFDQNIRIQVRKDCVGTRWRQIGKCVFRRARF